MASSTLQCILKMSRTQHPTKHTRKRMLGMWYNLARQTCFTRIVFRNNFDLSMTYLYSPMIISLSIWILAPSRWTQNKLTDLCFIHQMIILICVLTLEKCPLFPPWNTTIQHPFHLLWTTQPCMPCMFNSTHSGT